MADTVVELEFDPIFGNKAKKKLIKESEKAGEASGKRFGQGFKESMSKIAKGISGSIKRILLAPLRILTSKLAIILGGAGLALFFKKAIDESKRLQDSLIGLKSVTGAFGGNIDAITAKAKELAADGLIPLSDVTASLKNLIVNFDGDMERSVKTFESLRDAAAFNRQGQLSLGEAIRGASEGLKNDLSIKVDNAGVTKNLSVLNKEYAASIGTTIGKLTTAQKATAEYLGIQKEASIFQGDYNKLLGTFSGAMTKLQGSFRFFLAALGDIVTQSPIVIMGINKIAMMIQNLTKRLEEFGKSTGLKGIILQALEVGKAINNNVTTPLFHVVDAVKIVGKSMFVLFDGFIKGFGVVGGLIGSLLEKITGENPLTQLLTGFGEEQMEAIKLQFGELKTLMDESFGMERTEEVNAFFDNLIANVDQSEPRLLSFGDTVKKSMTKTSKAIINVAKAVNTAINKFITKAVSHGVQSLVKSLLEGESGFKNFGKKILGIAGDMAIQLGEMLIFTGLGIEALKSLGGAAAIAAGIGLIALGTILKSFSGDGGGGGGGGGSAPGAGDLVSAGLSDISEVDEVAEVAEPGTQVSVTIQGDVFDSDETGVRIAQILEDASLNQNVQVVGVS